MVGSRTKTEGYSLRFPDGLRERIKAVATANKRSLNAEIIDTLQKAYPDPRASLHQALQVIEIEIEKELDSDKKARLLAARAQLISDLYFDYEWALEGREELASQEEKDDE